MPFIGGKPSATLQAFTTPTNRKPVLRRSGINDLGFWVATYYATHHNPISCRLDEVSTQHLVFQSALVDRFEGCGKYQYYHFFPGRRIHFVFISWYDCQNQTVRKCYTEKQEAKQFDNLIVIFIRRALICAYTLALKIWQLMH